MLVLEGEACGSFRAQCGRVADEASRTPHLPLRGDTMPLFIITKDRCPVGSPQAGEAFSVEAATTDGLHEAVMAGAAYAEGRA